MRACGQGRCLLVSRAAENFPAQWLQEFEQGGIDISGVAPSNGFNPQLSEWFFYQSDGTWRDLVFASLADIAAHGVNLPSSPDSSFHLEPAERAQLIAAVEAASTGRVEPMPGLDPEARAQEIAALVADVEAIHVAPAALELHRALTTTLKDKGKLISLDPGHYIKNLDAGHLAEILQKVTIFAPSEREVHEFRGPCDLQQAAQDFAEMGPAIVVIKVGQDGALVFERDKGTFSRIPAYPARTLDPTGCGDSFCGGFLAGYMETGDAVEAARMGRLLLRLRSRALG